jgi:hypothetical protein
VPILATPLLIHYLVGFYINLPFGAATAVLLIFFFHPRRDDNSLRFRQKLLHLDLPGFVIFIPAVLMLLLAVEWGGGKFPWHSATIIGLLCGCAGMMVVFAVWQWYQKDEASIPPKIFLSRNILTASVTSFFFFGSLQLMIYYLPIWFQVIKRASPTKSGIMLLPTVIGTLIFTMAGGALGRSILSYTFTTQWLTYP